MKFEVTQQEMEYILSQLAARPYMEVKQLIEKLIEQANEQATR